MSNMSCSNMRSLSYGPTTSPKTISSENSNTSDNHTDNSSDFDDTIHFISPATSIARTENEDDYYGKMFGPYYGSFLPPPIYSYASSSTVSCEQMKLQRTLAIIKPEAMIYQDVVLRVIERNGLLIVNQRVIQATPEQISELYSQHYGSANFPHLVVTTSTAPIMILALAGLNAIEKWKSLIGPYKALKEDWFFPYSVRRRFGMHEEIPDALHASETVPEANKENRYFFSKSILEPLINEEKKVYDYCSLYINSTLLNGLTQLAKVKPKEPIYYLAEWLLLNNPHQPKLPSNAAMTPT